MAGQRGIEAISHAALGAAAEAATLQELAEEITRLIGPRIPHDGYGYQVQGALDPVVGAVMFGFNKHCYRPRTTFGLAVQHCITCDHYPLAPPGDNGRPLRASGSADASTGRHPVPVQMNPVGALIGGARRSIGAFNSTSPKNQHTEQLHEIMFTEGYGSDLRIGVTMRGRMWVTIALLRERGAKPFTADDLACAERMSDLLAGVLRRFTAGIPLRPARGSVPGTVIFDRSDRVKAATPTGRDWLREIANNPMHDGAADPPIALLGPVVAVRKGFPPVVTTVPTPRGWASIHAQPLDDGGFGDIAVTIQAATSTELFSGLAACRGITPREKAVIGQLLNGLSTKQIARRLDLSPHTVNDHFKAIYPKIGVTSREELITTMAH